MTLEGAAGGAPTNTYAVRRNRSLGMLYVGIDLSARRGFDVAVLDEERRVIEIWRAATLDLLSERLSSYTEGVVAAVDAPQRLSDFPIRQLKVRARLSVPPPDGRFARYRVCDYELARRNIGLYLLPEPGQQAPDWMVLGFETFALLRERHRLRLPRDTGDQTATLLEIYPYGGFVTLLGGRPPRKTTPEGAAARRQALLQAGLQDVPAGRLTHDAVDALCAAYTAWAWRHGAGSALGLPDEGLIVLPVPASALRDRYQALSIDHFVKSSVKIHRVAQPDA
jgi:predicted nuclease with RNAse H fold